VRTHSAFNNAAFLVTGSLPAFGWVRTLNPGEGRFYNESDEKEARRVAFLGTDAAKQLFPSGGAVGETIHLNDFPYTVIGVMEKKKQDSSYDG
jgi:putative ABC transport system permease protein